MPEFILYPAIDLRHGKVVRLQQGDPQRETLYESDPARSARRWLEDGARWLHVVNLDGAFGEEETDNLAALSRILATAEEFNARVQFGGGLRSEKSIEKAIQMGVARIVLGTVVVEQPQVLKNALNRHGAERIAASLDARDGLVRVRGWSEGTAVAAKDLAQELAGYGLRWLVFTDVDRDGESSGLNLPVTVKMAQQSGLRVIASGGVKSLEDIQRAREAGLAGAIVGRALYEGKVSIKDWKQ